MALYPIVPGPPPAPSLCEADEFDELPEAPFGVPRRNKVTLDTEIMTKCMF